MPLPTSFDTSTTDTLALRSAEQSFDCGDSIAACLPGVGFHQIRGKQCEAIDEQQFRSRGCS